MSLMRSMVNRISVTASPVTGMPSRNLLIRVSAACASVFEARQAEKAAGALDGVDEPENVAENLGVVGILLETHELDVDHVEALVGLDQEFLEKIIHCNSLCSGAPTHPDRRRPSRLSVASRRLLSVARSTRESRLDVVNGPAAGALRFVSGKSGLPRRAGSR